MFAVLQFAVLIFLRKQVERIEKRKLVFVFSRKASSYIINMHRGSNVCTNIYFLILVLMLKIVSRFLKMAKDSAAQIQLGKSFHQVL